ncbi:MAG: hypothetical protein WCQ21_31630 [Verrucomicrobiota bacterium]
MKPFNQTDNRQTKNMTPQITQNDPRRVMGVLTDLAKAAERPTAVANAAELANQRAMIWSAERLSVLPVLNAAAVNTIDASLKRVAILSETVRAFAIRILPLRMFSSVFSNVPLQGTDEVAVPYYPLQTVASSDRTTGNVPTYVFGQASSTSSKKITINKLKYQPLDYSSAEFRRQPFFDAVRLGSMNAEKLAVDVLNDILSVVTESAFGPAAKTTSAASITSDDVVDLRGACNASHWPDQGRSLIVDSSVDDSLQKDSAYKLALNIGTTSVIQEGRFPHLSGFDYAWMPSLPSNGENLIGFAAFASAILSAFAPVEPAPGVRNALVAYEVVTDQATGISFNYRHWGVAMDDRDYQVIECAYGYSAGVPTAIKRIVSPA